MDLFDNDKKDLNLWKKIAEYYAIIVIPGFMKRDSEELKLVKEKFDKQRKEMEYQKYLSLKEKYEG